MEQAIDSYDVDPSLTAFILPGARSLPPPSTWRAPCVAAPGASRRQLFRQGLIELRLSLSQPPFGPPLRHGSLLEPPGGHQMSLGKLRRAR